MPEHTYGRLLTGDGKAVERAYANLAEQPIDQEIRNGVGHTVPATETSLGASFSVTGPGTFFGRAQRTLTFEPTSRKGWWFHRTDLPDSMPIRVAADSVWKIVRNIVLCTGSPHNYVRMVEHIIALRAGMGLDNVLIRLASGDPPLFDRGSMDLVEGVEKAGIVTQRDPAVTVTVKEPVTVAGPNGSFLTFLPAENRSRTLTLDCAIDFKSAIGKQRIVFDVNRDTFRHGALARTNTNLWMMVYVKTIGKIFADVRHLGYTTRNILVAGRLRYINRPKLPHNGKSLEAVWHRATLDLLAAVSLIDRGRFAGKVVSYKSGHALDVQMIRELSERDLLTEA